MLDELLKEARGWLADCGSRVPDQDIPLVLKVNRDYDGGWPAFVRADPDASEQEVYDEVERRYPVGITSILYPDGPCDPQGDPGKLYL